MKRYWIMLLAVAVALVIALPAAADKPDKKPKPPASAPIAVYLDAEPTWVHEGSDVLRYTVTLQNKTSNAIDGITVKFSAATTIVDVDLIEDVEVLANEYVTFDDLSRDVSDFTKTATCEVGEECDLLATATVVLGSEVLTQEMMSTPLMPYPLCGFDGEETGSTASVSGVCIWDPPEIGIWTVSLDPTPPNNVKRPIDAQVAVRDGVPGNWCILPDGTGGVFSERWKVGQGPVVGEVYLPGTEGPEGEGVCLAGGAGGDYFAIGNPDGFYLRTDGTVTVTWKAFP